MWRIKLASGQAAAKASRTRDAISITRAPSRCAHPHRRQRCIHRFPALGRRAEDAGLVIDHEYFGRSLVIRLSSQ
jgi:hypothetical protein